MLTMVGTRENSVLIHQETFPVSLQSIGKKYGTINNCYLKKKVLGKDLK